MMKTSIPRNSIATVSKRVRYSTINTGVVTNESEKSHKFRNTCLLLGVSILSVYGGGVLLSERNGQFGNFFVNRVPYGESAIKLYENRGDLNLDPSRVWERLKDKYSSFITGRTVGIPVYRPESPEKTQRPVPEKPAKRSLDLSMFDGVENIDDPRLKEVAKNMNAVIAMLNVHDIPLKTKEKNELSQVIEGLFSHLTELDSELDKNIDSRVISGTEDRLKELDNKFAGEVEAKTSEIRAKYDEKFNQFKEALEERAAETLATGLKANEDKLKSKHANEIAFLSITQVEEFNKIITSKLERERNGKLENLLELDYRVNQFATILDSLNQRLMRDTAITELFSLVSKMKGKLASLDSYSIDIGSQAQHLDMIASILSSTSKKCKCCSSAGNSGDHKNCRCNSKKKSPQLLDVAISELLAITTDEKVLSNEQLYNRWSLLEKDFKTASLLPPNAGILGHLTAKVMSFLLFTKKGVSAEENDMDAVFSKIQSEIGMSDLKSAVEDVVQLQGWPRVLCDEWIKAARRKLEAESLLDVLEAELKTIA
ncbi:Mic60p KNAG_0C01590 [Huiozyma naganishii CBS 8797]|uniref:MICOS complex subunit MIC60 n=1 Tax=Huiozyma naganishii (strain ATCC MYA-139 / BCRC 22969 / CBS 8797 / KCTC 17520 / NBRC 10181 / NCYC 3082 / Yp74L-3) TaxID=1071383 RepID=J7RW99_HUIN7|nr:hypothetical protein KNAG_0C01590 [Kazachstania naganishii CBS 8797]CCK69272.1 hypothetical protein KNAG_0C01590 [Kazachstania naganishii CBS 8797]